MNRTLNLICLEFLHRDQDVSGYCIGCGIFNKDKVCPLYRPEGLINKLTAETDKTPLDTHSPETGERGKEETPVPLQPRAELGSSLDIYSFKTACPDYIVSGNMQLEDDYFGGERK